MGPLSTPLFSNASYVRYNEKYHSHSKPSPIIPPASIGTQLTYRIILVPTAHAKQETV